MRYTKITGSGCYIPEEKIDKDFFLDSAFYDENGQLIDKANDEIISKFIDITEINERRYIREDQDNLTIGTLASQKALEDARTDPESLDYIFFASNYGNVSANGAADMMPSMSARLKHKLGIQNRRCIVYDMIFGCPGWLEAVSLADTLITAGKAERILVTGAETLSRVIDPYDRNKMIFADGAGSVVLEKSNKPGILAKNTICDNGNEINYLKTGPSLNPEHKDGCLYINMAGRKIYEYALKNVPEAIKNTIDDAGLSIEDISKILIHQANAKMDYAIIDRLHRLYGIRKYDHTISPMTIQEFGNSSVATIPTMFDLIKRGKMNPHSFSKGDTIVMASVGASMNINCVVYTFS